MVKVTAYRLSLLAWLANRMRVRSMRSAPAEASVKKPAVPFASFDHGQTVIQHDHVALDDTCAE